MIPEARVHRAGGPAGAVAVLLLLPAIAGCIGLQDQPLLFTDAQGAPLDPYAGVVETGVVHEWDLYVHGAYELEPVEGKRFLGFAFGTGPQGPWSVPGPEIRVRQGDTVRVHLHDSSFHTIHWHGLSVPWAMDGVPFVTQDLAMGTYTYEFVAKEPGTYWYHCHVEAPAHVDAGLFGALIVEPSDPEADPPFDREETLILHEADSQLFRTFEWTFGQQPPDPGTLNENPQDVGEALVRSTRQTGDIAGIILEDMTGLETWAAGPREYYPQASIRYRPVYDTFMINGKSYPETEPIFIRGDEVLRLRLINAGQLVHSMHLHGHHFLVTHKDGYPLPAPYYADTIGLFPGERYDVYVRGYNPGIWDLHDHGGAIGVGGYTSNDFAFPGGMNTMLVYEDFDYGELPKPGPARTAGEYAVHAPSYEGMRP